MEKSRFNCTKDLSSLCVLQSFQNNFNIVQSHLIRLIYLIFLYFTLLSFP